MPARLFVAKLPFDTTESELREYFSQAGPVSGVILPTDRETGKKRGFAFIDFEDKANAEKAIREFDNRIFRGQTIHVSEARPREEKRPGDRPAPRYSGGPPRRPQFGGGGSRTGPDYKSDVRGDFGEDRPSRRSRSAGKGGSRKKTAPKAPRGPIRERRSGRLLDLGGDERDVGDEEFENLASSAPPDEEDSEE
jgi:RNA recognition motif-containing protein